MTISSVSSTLPVFMHAITMHAHDDTIFTILRFCCLRRDDNGIVFKNMQSETHFQKFAFSSPHKWAAKMHKNAIVKTAPKTTKKMTRATFNIRMNVSVFIKSWTSHFCFKILLYNHWKSLTITYAFLLMKTIKWQVEKIFFAINVMPH